jgi:hypothetical protein
VSYTRRDIEAGSEGETATSTWETTRTIEDQAEHALAGTVRMAARNRIGKVCCHTAFGLLCPEDRIEDLEVAIREARTMVDGFNATARHATLSIYVLPGRIARDDQAATEAILGEATDLLQAMEQGIAKADVTAIRAAASKAKAIEGMLSQGVASTLDEGIRAARKVARQVVRRVEKQGEDLAKVIADLDSGAVSRSRMALVAIVEQAKDEDPANVVPFPVGRAGGIL